MADDSEYMFDSFRFGFSAVKTASQRLSFDTGYTSLIDFSRDWNDQGEWNPSLHKNGNVWEFWFTGLFDYATGYTSMSSFASAYSNALVSCNRNYHRRISDIWGDFIGYETGSVKIDPYTVTNDGDTWINVTGSDGNLEKLELEAPNTAIDRNSHGFGDFSFPSGNVNCYTSPVNTQASLYTGGTLGPNKLEVAMFLPIPESYVTIDVKSTPYDQTSIKKIYFRDSANALVFYEYLGQDYTQALRRGEGMMWHGLGNGYINRAIVHDHFAWVYIDGQKYLCKSLGQDLSVY